MGRGLLGPPWDSGGIMEVSRSEASMGSVRGVQCSKGVGKAVGCPTRERAEPSVRTAGTKGWCCARRCWGRAGIERRIKNGKKKKRKKSPKSLLLGPVTRTGRDRMPGLGSLLAACRVPHSAGMLWGTRGWGAAPATGGAVVLMSAPAKEGWGLPAPHCPPCCILLPINGGPEASPVPVATPQPC